MNERLKNHWSNSSVISTKTSRGRWTPGLQSRDFALQASSTLRRNLKTQFYFLRLGQFCPHLSVLKTELFVNDLQTGRIWKRRLCVLLNGKKLKTKFFVNDDVTKINIIPCPSFTQIQMQNDRWLLRFEIHAGCLMWTENIWPDAYSEWNLCFQMFPAFCGLGLIA